jgi:hypothetical protein
MPDADELSFYRVSVMTIVTSSLAHYSSPSTHTSAPVCGIVAYRFRLIGCLVLSGLLRAVGLRGRAALLDRIRFSVIEFWRVYSFCTGAE